MRFGLRAADDPRIVDTMKVIDALLKTETATRPVWHRYNDDGYGEHEDGRAFDGTGVGRGWLLLVGERAHYELARGNEQEARRLCQVMAGQSSAGGLIPEQIWDAADIPERALFNGRPAGSAMPLVHAEHTLRDGRVFDMPPQAVQRYQVEKPPATLAFWRFNHKCHRMPAGKVLRIEVLTMRWCVGAETIGRPCTRPRRPTPDSASISRICQPIRIEQPGTNVPCLCAIGRSSRGL